MENIIEISQIDGDRAFEALFESQPGNLTIPAPVATATPPASTPPATNEPPATPVATAPTVPAFELTDTTLNVLTNTTDNPSASTPAATPASTATPVATAPAANTPVSIATNPQLQDVLKNTQAYLIENNIWADYEGRDTVELNDETWPELVTNQAVHAARQHFQQTIQSLPEDAQRLLSYISNGGDPSKVAQLYLNKQNVVSLNPQTTEDKTNYIKAYYSALNWSAEKVNSTIDRLKAGGDIAVETEFKDIEPLYKDIYNSKIEQEERVAAKKVEDQIERDNVFKENITNALIARNDLQKTDKERIYDFFMNHDQQLPDGRKMNKFFMAFAKTQQSVNDYIELGEFLLDKENYLARKLETKQTKTVNKGFSFLSSTGGGSSNPAAPAPVKATGTNFLI